jgi:hypothetical protein
VFVLIALALVFALWGLSMCRLAGHSDDAHLAALAEWIATSYIRELSGPSIERRTPSRRSARGDRRDEPYRAAG